MNYWARLRDGYKHKLTGMRVQVKQSVINPKWWDVVGQMPNAPPFDLYDVSGGEEFVRKEEAEKALKKWMAKDSDGDSVKNKGDCDPLNPKRTDDAKQLKWKEYTTWLNEELGSGRIDQAGYDRLFAIAKEAILGEKRIDIAKGYSEAGRKPQSAMLGRTMIELQDDGKYHVFVKTDDGEEKWIGSSKSFGSAKAILTKYEKGMVAKPRSGKKVYDFFEDAGHGWMKVKKSELEELGIADKISSYSYEKGDYAYLEEDDDANKFIKALEAKTGEKADDILEFKEHVSDTSAIRGYGNYQQPWGNKWLRNDLGYQTIYTKGDKQIKVIDNQKYYHSQGWGVMFSTDLQEPDRTFLTKEEAENYIKRLIPNL
jgi:hypothetical protein